MNSRPLESSGRRKKLIWLTIFLAVFYGMCAFQVLGHRREDWPFSWFGMFKGKMSSENIFRLDLEVVPPKGTAYSFFQYRLNGYFIYDRLEALILNQGLDLAGEYQGMKAVLTEDVVPVLKERGADPEAVVRVGFRFWKQFSADKRNTPDQQRTLLEVKWKDLL